MEIEFVYFLVLPAAGLGHLKVQRHDLSSNRHHFMFFLTSSLIFYSFYFSLTFVVNVKKNRKNKTTFDVSFLSSFEIRIFTCDWNGLSHPPLQRMKEKIDFFKKIIYESWFIYQFHFCFSFSPFKTLLFYRQSVDSGTIFII